MDKPRVRVKGHYKGLENEVIEEIDLQHHSEVQQTSHHLGIPITSQSYSIKVFIQ